tara:strand:- start:9 stop:149 length:141 start_codon:yes stop_codon:yes gene_type:complete
VVEDQLLDMALLVVEDQAEEAQEAMVVEDLLEQQTLVVEVVELILD